MYIFRLKICISSLRTNLLTFCNDRFIYTMKHLFLLIALGIGSGLTVKAQSHTRISLPALFSDHVVLQQQDSVPVWGWGEAGSKVCIVGSWSSKDTVSARVGDDGRWMAKVKTAHYGGPYTLRIFQPKREAEGIMLEDVMLGEVWLCSGQSNMEWTPANGLVDQAQEIGAANYPQIRFFSLKKVGSKDLQDDCQATWECCSPDVMRQRSAVAYFFGRQLTKHLKVPVGLIVSAWGGTAAEVWIPKGHVQQTPEMKKTVASRKCPWWPSEPGTLYNSMIHPLLPYRIAGAIWYQGESNRDYPQAYCASMKTLISSWRAGFGQDFPFYLVQIAPYNYKSASNGPALIREAQEQVVREVPHTGMVVTNDVGDYHSIHPIRKQEVGIRLANLALDEVYGKNEKMHRSPVFESMTVQRNKAVLHFRYAGKGLGCSGKKPEGFQIAGKDRVFVKAEARIRENCIEVYASQVKQPVAVRYCFDDATVGNVVNKSGLPLAPFRTDRWER